MPLPAGVQTCQVTFGGDVDFAGAPVAVTMTAAATHDLVWKATGQRVIAAPVVVTLAGTATGSVNLPFVDQTGWADGAGNDFTFWAYILTARYGNGETIVKNFQPLTGQTSVDFDVIPSGPITPGVSAPTAVVTSVNGLTGAVTVGSGGVTGTSFPALARDPGLLISGAVTRNAAGTAVSAAVTWPDGQPGGYLALTFNPSGAVDSWRVTYGSPVTKTYTQPAVTRDASGAVSTLPAIVVT